MQLHLQCGRFQFPVGESSRRPLVMGVLNVTPDSFSDGGRLHSLESALSRAEKMIADGVDIIDIGGESSRPGAAPLPVEDELERVMPVLYALRDCGKPISVDTYKPQIKRETIAGGADMINDFNNNRADGALSAHKDSTCGLCIMHMQRDPQTMQISPDSVSYKHIRANETDSYLVCRNMHKKKNNKKQKQHTTKQQQQQKKKKNNTKTAPTTCVSCICNAIRKPCRSVRF